MAEEKKETAKRKIGEKAANILTETSSDTNDGSQIMAQIDVICTTKGSKPLTEKTIEKQGAKWPEMMMGMWKNLPSLNCSNKAMEPLMEFAKMQHQSFTNMYQIWSDQLGNIGEATRSGDLKRVWETCMESNKENFYTYQGVMKEQATAQYELLRKFIPVLPNLQGART